MMEIEIINSSGYALPNYETGQSAGMDLRAAIVEEISLAPMERKLISTGLKIALPQGYEAQVRPRSGLALKQGITVLNAPGTIDADYRGDIGVILINLSTESVVIRPGDRIAQLVIAKYERTEWSEVVALSLTQRGEGGFGSTGKN
jgi:dUTP pyrophosphatase